MIIIKSPREIALMRRAGRVVAIAHEKLRELVKPGITTNELDKAIEALIREHGGIPSFKGYQGFPASTCISVNEQVVHGIPDDRVLTEGDIVSIDVGAIIEGFHGDAALTLPVGEISEQARQLLAVTEASLYAGIAAAKAGGRLTDISNAVEMSVKPFGYGVVRDFVGHGVGKDMHEEPQLPNFGPPGMGPVLKPGMTLAIEPMVNLGTYEVETLADQWTVVTKDRSLSAHFEHTIAITDGEAEILTRLE